MYVILLEVDRVAHLRRFVATFDDSKKVDEYSTRERAERRARELAKGYPGSRYTVVQVIGTAIVDHHEWHEGEL